MLVSRDYINVDTLEDFGKESFIKLPIENYLNLLGISPIAPQIALINAVNDPRHRFIVACLSRRTGKTYIANIIAQLLILVPGSNVLIMSPNYALSSISWDLQRQLLNKFEVEIERNNAKDRILTLHNGSSVRMGSVTTVDATVGRSYDLVLFDEAALNDKGGDAFQIALRPTLDKVNSKAIFISTPRKNNFFREFFDRGFSPEFPDWASIHSTYADNPRANLKDIAAAKKSMSKAEFNQEYLADFTALQGQIYDAFDKVNHVLDYATVSELIEVVDVIAGLDIGFRDFTALCVIVIASDGRCYLVDEYMNSGVNTKTHAEAIQEKLDKWQIDFVYIDSAAAQTKHDLAELYDIACMNAKKDKLPGIAYVSSRVEQDLLYVDKDCKDSIASLENYRWDTREGLIRETEVHDDYSHMADAIRYALYSHSSNMIQ